MIGKPLEQRDRFENFHTQFAFGISFLDNFAGVQQLFVGSCLFLGWKQPHNSFDLRWQCRVAAWSICTGPSGNQLTEATEPSASTTNNSGGGCSTSPSSSLLFGNARVASQQSCILLCASQEMRLD
jgi:hypothetical protein